LSIIVAITMLKPKAPEYPEFNTQTLELYKAISIAIATILANHWVHLCKNELFIDPEDAFICIYN
jgi:hypothetical protein